MGHGIDYIVDPQLVSFVGKIDRIETLVGPLPKISDIVIEVGYSLNTSPVP